MYRTLLDFIGEAFALVINNKIDNLTSMIFKIRLDLSNKKCLPNFLKAVRSSLLDKLDFIILT